MVFELHINCEGENHKIASTDHNFWRERRAEAESNQGPSAYQPNALPLDWLTMICLFSAVQVYTTEGAKTEWVLCHLWLSPCLPSQRSHADGRLLLVLASSSSHKYCDNDNDINMIILNLHCFIISYVLWHRLIRIATMIMMLTKVILNLHCFIISIVTMIMMLTIILNLHCFIKYCDNDIDVNKDHFKFTLLPKGLNAIVAWWHCHSLSLSFISRSSTVSLLPTVMLYVTVVHCSTVVYYVCAILCHPLRHCHVLSSIVSPPPSSVIHHAIVIHYAIHSLSSIVSLSPIVILRCNPFHVNVIHPVTVIHSPTIWLSDCHQLSSIVTLSSLTSTLSLPSAICPCHPLQHCHSQIHLVTVMYCVSVIHRVTTSTVSLPFTDPPCHCHVLCQCYPSCPRHWLCHCHSQIHHATVMYRVSVIHHVPATDWVYSQIHHVIVMYCICVIHHVPANDFVTAIHRSTMSLSCTVSVLSIMSLPPTVSLSTLFVSALSVFARAVFVCLPDTGCHGQCHCRHCHRRWGQWQAPLFSAAGRLLGCSLRVSAFLIWMWKCEKKISFLYRFLLQILWCGYLVCSLPMKNTKRFPYAIMHLDILHARCLHNVTDLVKMSGFRSALPWLSKISFEQMTTNWLKNCSECIFKNFILVDNSYE